MRLRLTPQAIQIYRLLLKEGILSASHIGKRLGIFPNAVYRSAHLLETVGLITVTHTYPQAFRPIPLERSIEVFLLLQRQWLLATFSRRAHTSDVVPPFAIQFLKDRIDMLGRYVGDVSVAGRTVDLVVSGLEVPAEVVLADTRALKRGVRIRILVQQQAQLDRTMLGNWLRQGKEVRVIPTIFARIIIIDKHTVYLMSYDPHDNEKAIGIRFAYEPIAQLMQLIFDTQWRTGKQI